MSDQYSNNNCCIDCGTLITNRSTRCYSCRGKNASGENSPNWRGNTTICPQCGGRKNRRAKICRSCSSKNKLGENNPSYRGATICPQCGGYKGRGAKVCQKCYNKTRLGENNSNWRGGISFFKVGSRGRDLTCFEYAEWRKGIFERDNFTCQHCQKKGGKLRAHHVLNFSSHTKLQLDVGNGITLCKNCHNLFHSLFGNKNNNLGQLEWFFSNVKMYKEPRP